VVKYRGLVNSVDGPMWYSLAVHKDHMGELMDEVRLLLVVLVILALIVRLRKMSTIRSSSITTRSRYPGENDAHFYII